jgi:uncharacterized membrane protein YkoI
MNRRIPAVVAVLALAAAGGGGVAAATSGAAGGSPSRGSRLDDGKSLLPQARITEQQAIEAAQSAASGSLNEVDLEDHNGQLVFNVDVGNKDVKVDASTGNVVAANADD